MSEYRRHMDHETAGLGQMRASTHTVHGIPVVTVTVEVTRGRDEDLIHVDDNTTALVHQGFDLAYGMARRVQDLRDGGTRGLFLNPNDRVTVWLEPDVDRNAPVIFLARDVGVDSLTREVIKTLDEISVYESEGLMQDWQLGFRQELYDALVGAGFDMDRFTHYNTTMWERGGILREFMEVHEEELNAEINVDDHGRRRLGWFQLRTYLNLARMSIHYMFFLTPHVPGGWKDGVAGLVPAQIYRFAEIIPAEVTKENDLCLYLAVMFASHFVFDKQFKQVEREDFDIPRSSYTWAHPIERMGNLRMEKGLVDCTNILEHLNALSVYFGAVIHMFEYESGGCETLCSNVRLERGQQEGHRIVFILNHHAYPVKKPHFLVQDAAKHLFCPVCFHCFNSKRDLFYHISRCTPEKAMDTIDYKLRRKFEKRSFVGKKFVVRGTCFKRCVGCGKLGVCGPGDAGGPSSIYCSCQNPLITDDSGSFKALRCMKCQMVFTEWDSLTHKCRMRIREDDPVDLSKVWVYDIESQLDTVPTDPLETFLLNADRTHEEDFGITGAITDFKTLQQLHTPNLIIAASLEGDVSMSFGCIKDFMDEIFENEVYDGARFYAHNAGRYDTHFIVNELLNRGCIPQFVPGSSAGYTNMLLVTFKNRSFADSYRLFPQALGSLAKSFDLPIRKGRFPYRFNMLGNENYCGLMPGLEWFDPWDSRGGPGELEDLMAWHTAESAKYQDGSWCLETQLYDYCMDDVQILRQVMLRGVVLFHDIFQRGGQMPTRTWTPPIISITNHLTLTSAVVGACLYGLKDSCRITLRDIDGVHMDQDRFFDMVLAYEFYFHERHVTIAAELALDNQYDDLFRAYELEDGKIRVYLDCFKCGCSKCYPMGKITVHPNEFTFGELADLCQNYRDHDLANFLMVEDSQIEYIYTHEYQEKFKEEACPELSIVIDPYWPIDAREAMFGGHTEAGALYAESFGRNKICKIDVNSMYPFVCAELELPFGDPQTLRMEDIDRHRFEAREYFGLVRAEFFPPKDLLFPILPRKVGKTGKLVFDCEDRVATYTTVDVYHALDLGYRVGKIFEIRHFPPCERRVGLFADYVYTLFGVKAEAKETHDPALYLLCKFALNSLWGKFGEKVHTSYYGFVSSVRGYMDFMHAETIKDGSREMMEVSENIFLVKAAYEDVVCDAPRYYHPELACFVLAHARKILHTAIQELGPGRFLYCDTDSIIYMHTEGQHTPNIGNGLGEWDIEVDGWPERYIKRFYSCGPKAYCEEYSDGTHKICYKGVMGSVRNKNILGPKSFRALILDYLNSLGDDSKSSMSVSTQDFSIRVKYMSNNGGIQVRSNYGVKNIRVVNEKRFVPRLLGGQVELEGLAMVRTLPYGFVGDEIQLTYVTQEDFMETYHF